MEKNKIVHLGIIGIFLSLYFLVATISMINSVAFFDLAHGGFMNWALAIGFELGAAASLAAIIILDKTNRTMDLSKESSFYCKWCYTSISGARFY